MRPELLDGVFDELDCGKHQESPEQVEGPGESLNKGSAGGNEQPTHNQRKGNSNQERLRLQMPRDLELGENN